MADDNTLRSYRSNDPYRRSAHSADAQEQSFGVSDPLAELARLIGQNDPYTDNIRGEPQAGAPRSQQQYEDPNDWRRHIQRPNYDTREEAPFDADERYGSADPHAGYADPHAGYADPHAGYAEHDPYRMSSLQPDRYADQHAHADYRHDQSYADAADDRDEPMYAAAPQRGHKLHTDEDYDDPPRRRRGGSSLVTAVVLIGCAMLGTAGAYGYRAYTNSPGSKQAPVIIADSAPSKIVPSTDQKSARSQDRVGQGNDERLVSREEQPVALPGTSAVPRVVFPSPIQPVPSTTGTTSPASSQGTEPKRIRTLTIRPDGGDVSSQPAAEAPARAAPSPPSARTAPPPTRTTRDQPLSLDPNVPGQASPPPQQRAPMPPAPRETAAPAPAGRVAAVQPSGGTSGGYLVQVSSQKSEADAQASYRGLQAKYSLLQSHQAVIRRADLGSKGVFYRAMVGPFETGDEAVQFCNGLKQAGGQCIIHRN